MKQLTRAQYEEKKRFIHQVGGSAGCLRCRDNTRIQAAHIKFSEAASGKAHPGHTNKDHYFVVPLCVDCHASQPGDEREWWSGWDILGIAAKLHITWEKGDFEGGCNIIEAAHQ